MTEAETAMEQRLKQVFTNPQLRAKIVDSVVRDRPLNWSPRSSSPYYKECYAIELKKVLDGMIASELKGERKEFCYPYDWFEKTFGLGKDSLYLRVYQSRRFLLERMDPDHIYEKFFERLDVTRERGRGVVIRFSKIGNENSPPFEPVEVLTKSEAPKWRRRMDVWLQSEDIVEPFSQENLILTPEEIKELKVLLLPLTNVFSSVTAHSVKLIKIT